MTQEFELLALARWAPTDDTLTLDFGDYYYDYVIFHTPQNAEISALLGQNLEGNATVDFDDEGVYTCKVGPRFLRLGVWQPMGPVINRRQPL